MSVLCDPNSKLRVMARLDVKGQYLIKGIQMEGLRKVGDPHERALKYYYDGVDEIIYLDLVATLYGRSKIDSLVALTSKDVFVPITVAGGVRSVEDAADLFAAGADKIAINTAAVNEPKLINRITKAFGSQCLVLSIEAKKVGSGTWSVFTHGGRENTDIDVLDWVKTAVDYGVGEIFLTSIDRDGTRIGFDKELIVEVASICPVPLVISGGFGALEHLDFLACERSISGVAVGDAFHYGRTNVSQIKRYLDSIFVNTRH